MLDVKTVITVVSMVIAAVLAFFAFQMTTQDGMNKLSNRVASLESQLDNLTEDNVLEFISQNQQDMSAFVLASNMPNFANYVEIGDLPDFSLFAKASEVATNLDVASLVTSEQFSNAFSQLGTGLLSVPTEGNETSQLCSEGSTMVGARVFKADGNNANQLYFNIYPICRSLIR